MDLNYKQFGEELIKAKVKLGVKEKASLFDYFEEQKLKALAIKSQIEQTDKKIDYEFYQLTEEKIKIVKEQ